MLKHHQKIIENQKIENRRLFDGTTFYCCSVHVKIRSVASKLKKHNQKNF